MFYIWSIEHNGWWREGRHGYAECISQAGVFSEIESKNILKKANLMEFNECLIPVTSIICDPETDTPMY